MQTIAWLFIVIAAILVRQVAKGRAIETPGDIRDMFVAVVTMDNEALKEAVSRTGTSSLAQISGEGENASQPGSGPSAGGSAVLAAAIKRGSSAKGYKFGTLPPDFGVGPNWYDCSGLVWRAMQDAGYKSYGRVTTYTWPTIAKKVGAKQVTDPQNGDIVVWQRGGTKGHMGIVTTGGKFYGAQSAKTGIKEVPIKGVSGRISYWRLP